MKIKLKNKPNIVNITKLKSGDIFIYDNHICIFALHKKYDRYIVRLSNGEILDAFFSNEALAYSKLLVTRLSSNIAKIIRSRLKNQFKVVNLATLKSGDLFKYKQDICILGSSDGEEQYIIRLSDGVIQKIFYYTEDLINANLFVTRLYQSDIISV